MAPTLFSGVELAPRDPILGLTEAFAADPRQHRVNLGVGVYTNDAGRIPLLQAVREAESVLAAAAAPRGYLPIEGSQAYDAAVQELLLGEASPLIASRRVITAQALGGTGALRIGADLLKRIDPAAQVLISDPSWENHRALFEAAGFAVSTYPYYNPGTHGVDFAALRAVLSGTAAGTIVVLHACCHNPTGVDLTAEQWRELVAIVTERNLVPFLDIAYQGFGESIEADATAVRLFAASGVPLFVASSFSKSFSLYGERVGALTIVAGGSDEAARVLSQLKRVIRTSYSNPPRNGGSIVAAILADPRLRALWETELASMRNRIRQMRVRFVEGLKAHSVKEDFAFVLQQRGMFSYSGLTAAQVERLKTDFGIYAVSSGRICVAALNSGNIDYVCDSIASVLTGRTQLSSASLSN